MDGYLDDLFYGGRARIFAGPRRFFHVERNVQSDSRDFVCSLARGEHCSIEMVGNVRRQEGNQVRKFPVCACY